MRLPIVDYLDEVLVGVGGDNPGATADYIPELADADPNRLGVCVATIDGTIYGAGDIDVPFSIQSISKPFAYALALAEHGLDHVLERVGVEPSGEAFNELSLEEGSGRPLNPMINAGALTTHALLGGPEADANERFEIARSGMSAFAGRELGIDENVYKSERETAYRNTAIANMLRSYGTITGDPNAVVDGYTRQCSVLVTLRDLAQMAATLANAGRSPTTGDQIVPRAVVRQVLSVMMTCGMYDAAGDWMSTIGFPAKSGVAGGILGALPGQVGIATFSPRLDGHGNSVRGVRICNRMSKDMGMHIMEGAEPARSVIRRDRVLTLPGHRRVRVCSLQGTIGFSGAERVLRTLAERTEPVDRVVIDLRRTYAVNDVARRMIAEAARRLQLDGTAVSLLDPERVLADTDAGEAELITTLDKYRPY